MDASDAIALIISTISLSVSFYVACIDRSRLQLTARYFSGDGDLTPRLTIVAVNVGRRPIILRMWGGNTAADHWAAEYFSDPSTGIRLGESERHEFRLTHHDLYLGSDDPAMALSTLWIEDSTGKRHYIKNSNRLVTALLASQIR